MSLIERGTIFRFLSPWEIKEKEILTLNWTILCIYEVLKRDNILNDLQGEDIPPVSDHLGRMGSM